MLGEVSSSLGLKQETRRAEEPAILNCGHSLRNLDLAEKSGLYFIGRRSHLKCLGGIGGGVGARVSAPSVTAGRLYLKEGLGSSRPAGGGCNSPGGGESACRLRNRLPSSQIWAMKSGTVRSWLLEKRREWSRARLPGICFGCPTIQRRVEAEDQIEA